MAVLVREARGRASVGGHDPDVCSLDPHGSGIGGPSVHHHAGGSEPLEQRREGAELAHGGDGRRRPIEAWRGFGRGGTLRSCGVVVEPPSALAPEPSGPDQLLLDEAGLEALVVEIGRPHGRGDGEVDVVPDEVHQLEGPHGKAPGLAYDRIQRGTVGRSLGEHAQGLGIEGTGHAIDDEPRRGARHHGDLAPAHGGVPNGLRHFRCRGQTAHHLHQLHARRRIEEMHANHPLGARERSGDGGDRQRRRVGGKDRLRRYQGFERGEERPLHLQILDDRLDHQMHLRGDALRFGHRPDTIADRARLFGAHPPLAHPAIELFGDRRERAPAGLLAHVGKKHQMVGTRRHQGDPAPHRPGADHQHGLTGREGRAPFAFLHRLLPLSVRGSAVGVSRGTPAPLPDNPRCAHRPTSGRARDRAAWPDRSCH